MVQRSGSDGSGKITFVQNNFYYDAFFLKAIGTHFQFICDIMLIGSQSFEWSMRQWLVCQRKWYEPISCELLSHLSWTILTEMRSLLV